MGVCVRSQRDRARSVCSTQLIPGPNLPILPDHSPQGAPQESIYLTFYKLLKDNKKTIPK